MTTLSREQQFYLDATIIVETIADQVRREVEAIGIDDTTEEGLDAHAYAWVDAEARLGHDAARKLQREAADALLAWGHKVVKRLPQYKPVRKTIDELYAKVDRFPSIRQKLIDTTMRLSVS